MSAGIARKSRLSQLALSSRAQRGICFQRPTRFRLCSRISGCPILLAYGRVGIFRVRHAPCHPQPSVVIPSAARDLLFTMGTQDHSRRKCQKRSAFRQGTALAVPKKMPSDSLPLARPSRASLRMPPARSFRLHPPVSPGFRRLTNHLSLAHSSLPRQNHHHQRKPSNRGDFMPSYYLLKTESSVYSFANLQRDQQTQWDGVTNPTAVKNLREMKPGDKLIIYHTGDEKSAVGTATVVSVTTTDPKKPVVEIKAGKPIAKPVTLAEINPANCSPPRRSCASAASRSSPSPPSNTRPSPASDRTRRNLILAAAETPASIHPGCRVHPRAPERKAIPGKHR